jgi:glycerophosphoryl diester phosphodiesterase
VQVPGGGLLIMSVLRIAHRGGAATRPENTLSAFANAIALGADGAELDVQLTRDGQVVVFHDFCLKPDLCRDTEGNWLTSNGPRIADLGREEIAGYDVGRARPGSEYALQHPDLIACDGARIPLLAEIVALARRASQTFSLFVELKTSLAGLSASPENLAEATLAVLRESDYLDQCVIVGFDWRGLRRAKEIEPSTACWFSTRPQSWFRDGQPPPEDDPPAPPVLEALRNWARSGTSPWADGFDAVGFGGSIVEAVKAAGADGWFPYAADATREAIARAHNLGLRVGAWTVDEREQMNALIGNGIDAICTDREDFFADHARN